MDVINILSLLDMGGGRKEEREKGRREEGEKVPLISRQLAKRTCLLSSLLASSLLYPHACVIPFM